MIDTVEPHAEFLVTKENKVEIRFLDEAGKVIAPAAQTANVVMGDRTAPTKLTFTKDGDQLVSDKVIAKGESQPVVLMLKNTPEAKTVTEKFNLDFGKCPPCGKAEYACSCDHAKGSEEKGHEDHDHKPGEKHEHEEHVTKGPNGGHVINSKSGFSFEVTVDKDRKARIVFLDKKNKALALAEQSITGIAGERSAPTKLTFAKGMNNDANVLISDVALPTGSHVAMILTIKTAPDAKAVTERFELHLH